MQIAFSVQPVLCNAGTLAQPVSFVNALNMALAAPTTALFDEVTRLSQGLAGAGQIDAAGVLGQILSGGGGTIPDDVLVRLGRIPQDTFVASVARFCATGPSSLMGGVTVGGVGPSKPAVRRATIGGIKVVVNVSSDMRLRMLDLKYEMSKGNQVLSLLYSSSIPAQVGSHDVTTPGALTFSERVPKTIILVETRTGFDLFVRYLPENTIKVSFKVPSMPRPDKKQGSGLAGTTKPHGKAGYTPGTRYAVISRRDVEKRKRG